VSPDSPQETKEMLRGPKERGGDSEEPWRAGETAGHLLSGLPTPAPQCPPNSRCLWSLFVLQVPTTRLFLRKTPDYFEKLGELCVQPL
jgi:hypothetical protein